MIHTLWDWKLTSKEGASRWVPTWSLYLQVLGVEYSSRESHYPVLVGNHEQENSFFYFVWISETFLTRKYLKSGIKILFDQPWFLRLTWFTHMKSQMWIDDASELKELDSFYAWNENQLSLLKQQSFYF